jgi:dihydrodipicolinate reductase
MEKVRILWSGITGRTGVQALKATADCEFAEIVAGICQNDSTYYNYNQLDKINHDNTSI